MTNIVISVRNGAAVTTKSTKIEVTGLGPGSGPMWDLLMDPGRMASHVAIGKHLLKLSPVTI